MERSQIVSDFPVDERPKIVSKEKDTSIDANGMGRLYIRHIIDGH